MSAAKLLPDTAFRSLWISGLALLLLLVGNWWLPAEVHRNEWIHYLVSGTLFPLLALALNVSCTKSREAGALPPLWMLILSGFSLFSGAIFLLWHFHPVILCLSLVTLVGLKFLEGQETGAAAKLFSLPSDLVPMLITAVAWLASWQLLWWDAVPDWTVLRLLGRCTLAIIFLGLTLSSLPSYRSSRSRQLHPAAVGSRLRGMLKVGLISGALPIFALASLRTYYLSTDLAFHHWGFYVGPVELVRQGGWLLWDVPSQYGFLSILTLAVFPLASPWQALYVVNALLLWSSACCLFFVLCALRANVINIFFSLGLTLAVVFLLPGWAPEQIGPQSQPNVGALRFCWCYALIAILVWEFKSASRHQEPWSICLMGCLAWLLGTLWSVESAVYCTAIWLPAYLLMIWRRYQKASLRGLGPKPSALRWVLWVLLPLIGLMTALGAISAVYRTKLGHGPDWAAFWEYSLAYSSHYIVSGLDPKAPFWALFMIFCVLSTVCVHYVSQNATHPASSLLVGNWGMLWSTTSWLIAIGSPSRLLNLSPIFCLAMANVFLVMNQEPERDVDHGAVTHHAVDRDVGCNDVGCNDVDYNKAAPAWVALARMTLIPTFVVMLTTTFGSRSIFTSLHSMLKGYDRQVARQFPGMAPALASLLKTAQVRPSEPIIIVDMNHLPLWPIGEERTLDTVNYWLPTVPYAMFHPLPEKRRRIYVARFITRRRLSGWLIQRRHNVADELKTDWLLAQLQATHVPTRTLEKAQWRLTWFRYSIPTAAANVHSESNL